jgi:hypothetical protein
MAAWFAKMNIVALPAQLSLAHAGTQMDFSRAQFHNESGTSF